MYAGFIFPYSLLLIVCPIYVSCEEKYIDVTTETVVILKSRTHFKTSRCNCHTDSEIKSWTNWFQQPLIMWLRFGLRLAKVQSQTKPSDLGLHFLQNSHLDILWYHTSILWYHTSSQDQTCIRLSEPELLDNSMIIFLISQRTYVLAPH